ncbi:protein PALS2-like isoform X2 [Apostichopus japonicus]|uniref:protein PALS2-like isoform X2 n=1 Tax=Stichopus japonicus TaxID=307972 RepID=UPI003AB2602E
MPIASSSSTESGQEALETIIDHLDMVNSAENGPPDMDLLFLKEVMRGKLMQNLVKAHDTLEDKEVKPCHTDSVGFTGDIIAELTSVTGTDQAATELAGILQDLHFISLLQTHDEIASGNLGRPEPSLRNSQGPDEYDCQDTIKLIGIRKVKDQPLHPQSDPYLYSDPVVIVDMIRPKGAPLGITVRCDKGALMVARILHGGIIDQQGLLHVGDIIKEINDVDIKNNPTAFNHELAQSNGRVTLKILPNYRDSLPPPPPIYLRAFFSYNPKKDTLLPCSDIGLAFEKGDVLCVVDRSDPEWWQAYVVGREETSGLIPSEELEEKRRAFVPSDHLYTKRMACGLIKAKKKKKSSYETRKNYQFDKSDIISYEEVQEMPPFLRKTLILIGAQGVGRRVIVNHLIKTDPERFGSAIASTSRPKKDSEVDGVNYNFSKRKDLENDITHNRLLEYGEFMGNIYGTSFDAVKKVYKENKICVLDVNPQTLKLLRNSEYLPFVVFVKSPNLDTLRAMHQQASRGSGVVPDSELQKTVDESERIEQLYSHLFDFTIVNDNLDDTCDELLLELENLETQRQWVPVTWVYDCP